MGRTAISNHGPTHVTNQMSADVERWFVVTGNPTRFVSATPYLMSHFFNHWCSLSQSVQAERDSHGDPYPEDP